MKSTKFLVILLVLLTACSSADKAISTEEAMQTKDFVENNDYEVQLQWARPLATSELSQLAAANLLPMDSRSGQINLRGTQNFIRKHGDSLSVYLPYFGTRQVTINPADTNGAIEFDGVPEDYRVSYNEKRQRSVINFSMDDGNENFNVAITVWANKRAQVNVNSSFRNSIFYTGNMKALKNE